MAMVSYWCRLAQSCVLVQGRFTSRPRRWRSLILEHIICIRWWKYKIEKHQTDFSKQSISHKKANTSFACPIYT